MAFAGSALTFREAASAVAVTRARLTLSRPAFSRPTLAGLLLTRP